MATRLIDSMYAAVRIFTRCCFDNESTSWKLRVMMPPSRSFTSASDQKYPIRSCTHSKYDTVTPPAFARMSGITKIPFSSRIGSAAAGAAPKSLDAWEELARELSKADGIDAPTA